MKRDRTFEPTTRLPRLATSVDRDNMDGFLLQFELMNLKPLLEQEQVTLKALPLLSAAELKDLKIPLGPRAIILKEAGPYVARLAARGPDEEASRSNLSDYSLCVSFLVNIEELSLAEIYRVAGPSLHLAVILLHNFTINIRLEILGTGANGTVWRAQAVRSGGLVALKVVPIRDAAHEEKLRNEAALHSRLRDTRHLVRLHECFVHLEPALKQRSYCFSTEYCDKGDLNTLIKVPPVGWGEKVDSSSSLSLSSLMCVIRNGVRYLFRLGRV